MDNNKVCDVLRNEGLMPINEEIGITFKYEMLTYGVSGKSMWVGINHRKPVEEEFFVHNAP